MNTFDTTARLAALHHADLHAEAAAYRLAAETKAPGEIRRRVGWTLVEIGLRMAATQRPTTALA
ncbi:hypothetical protein [Streptomyces mangrovisoli]|uniref:Uncharacterized protein n=1 Tax=Streptomyces mangrovisoli TaxID=1428628 RepID=A0A1J4P2K0_9ACTN|nr:hypothetical protein [Streptomyces mangrovisoli]OIJ67662.1 hypothetical protein WN71_012095 [Streptomyces mangrovisoli]